MRLRIVEELWGIDRRTGKRSVNTTDNRVFPVVAGSERLEMPKGGRRFTIDAVDASGITVTVHCRNQAASRSWVIPAGESRFYLPHSMDGGYRYRLFYEDETAPNYYAIGMQVEKAEGDYDPAQSKFFGAPVIPGAWKDRFHDDIVFFAQIRLSELAHLDPENRLPHTGYLYFFLDAEMYPSDQLDMWVEYYPGEPDMIVDDFNEASPIPQGLNQDWLITFHAAVPGQDGTKLLGVPSDPDVHTEGAGLLLQYAPLDFEGVPFLSGLDGYAYVFFGSDPTDYDAVTYRVVRS